MHVKVSAWRLKLGVTDMDDVLRFSKNVQPAGECLRWLGRIQPNGYGQFRLEGKAQYAHRASYKLFKGDISASEVILHTCDNRWCVNPAHLVKGTQAENLIDMARKGRSGLLKLTNDEVINIRQDHRKTRDIAEQYNVSMSTIQKIRKGTLRRYI